jgi:hypothetical protein
VTGILHKHSAASRERNCIDKDLTSAVRALPKETVNNAVVRMVHDITRIIFPWSQGRYNELS